MGKIAIVTGVPGMDASHLCELLLSKPEYDEVVGVSRRSTRDNDNMVNCAQCPNRYQDVMLDITDTSGVRNLIAQYQPDEIFQLAAMSHVGQSFNEPISTLDIDGRAHVGFLEAINIEKPSCRMYFAATSELFGNSYKTREIAVLESDGESIIQNYQDETTPFNPRSPYAAAKLYAYHMTRMYREAYGLFVCSGILFNHAGPRRGKDFVTRKITHHIARIKHGLQKTIKLGNLKPSRDFGHSEDYCEAMYLMLQQETPDDYVIATGEATSVQSVLKYVCELAGLNWEDVYEQDKRFMRPADVDYLCGDPSKALNKLGWAPKRSWKDTLKEMYENDLRLVNREIVNQYEKTGS